MDTREALHEIKHLSTMLEDILSYAHSDDCNENVKTALRKAAWEMSSQLKLAIGAFRLTESENEVIYDDIPF